MKRLITVILIFLLGEWKHFSIEGRSKTRKQSFISKKVLGCSKDVLDKIKHILTVKVFFMNFEYEVKGSDFGKLLSKEKVSLLVKNNKYYLSSPDYEIKCNGKILWKYIPNINQLQIAYVNDCINFWSMLSCFEKYYKIESYQDIVLNNVICVEVSLVAKSPDNEYNSVQIFFKKSSFDLIKIEINDMNRIKHIIYIDQFEKKQNIDESIFNWNYDDSQDLEVIDLRK